jgi:pentatricopeptide repeat protein
MKLFGVLPNEKTFNILISMHGRIGQLKEVSSLLQEMHKSDILPNEDTYLELIAALNAQGKLKDIDKVLDTMKNQDLNPTIRIFNSILSSYEKNNANKDSMMKVMEWMEEYGIIPGNFISQSFK